MIRIFKNGAVLFFLPFYWICNSCAPKIKSFTAKPFTTIVAGDSVQLNWRVRGRPSLLVYEDPAGDDENPSKHYLSYKLVAQKGNKEVSYPTLSLTVLPDTSTDNIVINTIRRGDSAVAIAVRDTNEWGHHFVIAGLASGAHRNITVTHMSKTVMLSADGQVSDGLNGLSNSGTWQLSTALSPAEKKDSTLIPGRLVIKTIIIHRQH